MAASIRLLKATKICVMGKSHFQSRSCIRCNYTQAFRTQTRHSGGKVSTWRHLGGLSLIWALCWGCGFVFTYRLLTATTWNLDVQVQIPLGAISLLCQVSIPGPQFPHQQSEGSVSRSVVSLSRVQLCDSMDCSPPGSSVYGILEARILEWVAIPFSRGSS